MELELNNPSVLDSNTMKIDVAHQKEVVAKFDKKSPTRNDDSSRTQSLEHKDSTAAKEQDDHEQQQLETTKQEMGEVREENQRLKMVLARIVKDYQSLQTKFFDVVQQEESIKPSLAPSQAPPSAMTMTTNTDAGEEPELVCLRLGTSSTNINKDNIRSKHEESDQIIERGLTLGLDYTKLEPTSLSTNKPVPMNLSQENNPEEPKEEEEEEAGELRPPIKMLKNLRSDAGEDQDVSQQTHAKKARVSVRARCDTPTMNDGCHWRKYGQKIAKGNPCPRAYYRCTVAPSCPVRKQVQRSAEDMSILITTYEGTHNHPLPISATAMASTTSAAACMLMSGHSAARPGIASTVTCSAASLSNTTLQGLNVNLSDHISRSGNFYLPNTSISSSPSYPTITLDLTAPPSSTSATYPSQFSRFSSPFSSAPRYTSASFNFSLDSNSISAPSWTNAPYLSYGAKSNYNKKTSFQPLFSQKTSGTTTPVTTLAAPAIPTVAQNASTDTIVKAITSDPSFQLAVASAITSYAGAISGAQGSSSGSAIIEESMLKSLAQPLANGHCSSSFLTRSNLPAANCSEQSIRFMQASPVQSSSPSASPLDNRENTS